MRRSLINCWLRIGLLLVSGAVASEDALARSANLSVPGRALIFDGLGLQAPDNEGHFAVGITLPQPNISASGCEGSYLIVGMGTLNKPENRLTAADRVIIQRNKAYWDRLVGAAEKNEKVEIPVSNEDSYLRVVGGNVIARYCVLSIDEGKVR